MERESDIPVVVFTFDDGGLEHYEDAAPILEKYGFRGTFNVVASTIGLTGTLRAYMTWSQCRNLARRGHAIENHTMTHPNLRELAEAGKTDELRREIVEARDIITKEVGIAPKLLCHPFCQRNEVVDAEIRAAGMVPMDWHRCNFGEGTNPGDATKFIEERQVAGVRVIDLLAHGVRKEGGFWRPFATPADFEAFVREVKALVDQGKVRVGLYRDEV